MAIIVLGNTAPIEATKVDDTTDVVRVSRSDLGNTETVFDVPDNVGVGEALSTISSVFASHHSDEKPAWVESDDDVIASAIARQFDCPVGRPDEWTKDTEEADQTQTPGATV